MQSDDVQGPDDAGIATWKVELAVALILLLCGVVVAFKSWQLGAGWQDDGPGAGYFPFYIGLFITLACAGIIGQVWRSGRHDARVFVSHNQLKLVMVVLVPSIAFVLAVQFLGLYIGSWLFIAAFMKWVGKYGWLRSMLVALAVAVVAFLMFEVWFKVPLYKGSLHPLSVLGY